MLKLSLKKHKTLQIQVVILACWLPLSVGSPFLTLGGCAKSEREMVARGATSRVEEGIAWKMKFKKTGLYFKCIGEVGVSNLFFLLCRNEALLMF